ncbi:MAG: alpha/beta hydrolase [Pseudomonadota bacterium]|nr:alpha/beta hydrolase [Pseudomonadota bacterium]
MPIVRADHDLEVALFEPHGSSSGPTLVLLHEGLGSVAMWREFPERLALVTGCSVLAYSRYGYGQSEALEGPRDVRYMHDEALSALPKLLDALALAEPILVGHSDGASIALICAGAGRRPLRGVVAIAPHVIVEDCSIESIAAAQRAYESTDLRQRLARYHAHVDSAFRGWNDIWLHPDFRSWSIEEYLPRIACPVLVIQGGNDEYGTADQVHRIARQVANTDVLMLDHCGHSPHRDDPAAVLEAIRSFVERVR